MCTLTKSTHTFTSNDVNGGWRWTTIATLHAMATILHATTTALHMTMALSSWMKFDNYLIFLDVSSCRMLFKKNLIRKTISWFSRHQGFQPLEECVRQKLRILVEFLEQMIFFPFLYFYHVSLSFQKKKRDEIFFFTYICSSACELW